jgi:hypothetical protein
MAKEIDIKRIKRKRNIGIGLFIIGCILVGNGIIFPITYDVYYVALFIHYIPSVIFGFILVVIGIFLILKNRRKASKT